MSENLLEWPDFLVFASMLVLSLSIGLYHGLKGDRQNTTNSFLMGNHKLKMLPVSLSVYMSYLSAVTVLGTTAEMYTFGTQQLMNVFGSISGYLVAAFIVVPVLYPLRLISSYQYYEMRFNSEGLRRLLAVISVIQTVFLSGLVVFAPSTALESVTGFPMFATVLCTVLVATIYSSIGGMKAVVWTDALQGIIFFGGLIAVLVVAAIRVGGLDEVWKRAEDGGRIIFFNTDIDPKARITLWNTAFGNMATTFGVYGVGQSVIQRYTAIPTVRGAQMSLLLNIPMTVLVYTCLGLTGLAIYAYYDQLGCDPLRSNQISFSNQLLPYFIVNELGYAGFSGLFIAVLFSAALSSISSNMSSNAAVIWKDFLEPLFKTQTEWKKALVTKIIVIIFGVLTAGMAYVVSNLTPHVLQIANAFMGAFGGSSSGALLLGLFFPCGNWIGAFSGIIAGLALGMWMNIGQFLASPYYATLPTDVSNCTLQPNVTIPPPRDDDLDGIFPLYTVSYNWFGVITMGLSLFVGLVVSILTTRFIQHKVDKRLVIPLFDQCCPYLPMRVRRVLWCGLEHDNDEDDDEKSIEKLDQTGKSSSTTHFSNGVGNADIKISEEQNVRSSDRVNKQEGMPPPEYTNEMEAWSGGTTVPKPTSHNNIIHRPGHHDNKGYEVTEM